MSPKKDFTLPDTGDQLWAILSKKGAQDKLSLNFIETEQHIKQVKELGLGLLCNHNTFLDPLKKAEPQLAEILESMLEFNPYFRKTA